MLELEEKIKKTKKTKRFYYIYLGFVFRISE
jgi:hypothetical protein